MKTFYLCNAFCHCVRPGQLWLHRSFIVITSSAFFSCFVLLVFLDLLFVLLGPCLKFDFFLMFLHPAVFVWPCALWFWPSPAALFIKISIYMALALTWLWVSASGSTSFCSDCILHKPAATINVSWRTWDLYFVHTDASLWNGFDSALFLWGGCMFCCEMHRDYWQLKLGMA